MADAVTTGATVAVAPSRPGASARALRNPGVIGGGVVMVLVVLIGLLAPWLGTIDPTGINPAARNRVPGAEFSIRTDTGERIKMVARFGTDSLGRDIYSRVVYGAREGADRTQGAVPARAAQCGRADRHGDWPRNCFADRRRGGD